MPTIEQLITAINPELYYKTSGEDKEEAKKEIKEFKKLVEELGITKAAEKAKPKTVDFINAFPTSPESEVQESSGTIPSHTLVYDSSSETLEPVYFWLLDLMTDLMGWNTEKLVDNFSSTPGSGHFSELQGKATAMQQQASKILADINLVLRSVINIIYDLKEFKIRLEEYEKLKSTDKNEKSGAILSLKQVWMDKVDIQKGNSSIKAMALGQAGFQTLLDAFLVANSEEEAEKLDLNERVKRIVKSRVGEFNIWLKNSEEELKKRYQLEKTYLKSQVDSLKIYSRWAKPYLKAATDLEQKEQGRNPNFIKTFNTIILELTLLGKQTLKPKDLAIGGRLPEFFKEYKGKRTYSPCVLVTFRFRGIPQKAGQHYLFGGKVEFTTKPYALNSEELELLNQELENSDLSEILKLVEGTTTESLEQLKKDIDLFLEEKSEEIKEKEKSTSLDINPFLALIGKHNKKLEKEQKEKEKKEIKLSDIKPDSYAEKYLRVIASQNATKAAYDIFDIYKKAHKMISYS